MGKVEDVDATHALATEVEQSEPRIVSPQEARGWIDSENLWPFGRQMALAHTVATEPDRIRAVVRRLLDAFAPLDTDGHRRTAFRDGEVVDDIIMEALRTPA